MIRRFLRISRSILEEWTAMFSGRFPPYHKMGIAVAVITTVAFSIILSHDVVFEAPVAVIDLDQSRWSAELIEKLNASSYLQVERVVHSPADPRRMTAHDRVQAVIFIPKDAQASLLRGAQTVRLGTYLDDSNTAQNGGLISQLNENTAETRLPVPAASPHSDRQLPAPRRSCRPFAWGFDIFPIQRGRVQPERSSTFCCSSRSCSTASRVS